jgi:uncharacterized membrane protein YedE/YeeE
MIEFLSQPWPWWTSGIVIATVMFILLFFGQSFGFSSNLRTVCSIAGAGKWIKFFDFNWKSQQWNLVFMLGTIIGGFIAHNFLSTTQGVQISANTIKDLSALGLKAPTGMQPEELFGLKVFTSLKGIIILVLGGFMVGFGARYAGGCTSGHAISGLSDLQFPSLIAVMGFFIGGLFMTYIIFPILF